MDPAPVGIVMKLTDLRNKPIRTIEGDKLGTVHEVHCDKGRIIALMSGPGSFIERFTARKHGRRIPWECVLCVEPDQVVVTADPPQRIVKKASASRSPQGTRRPSARRSKR
jgi:sporulation protein YlmC with PRC-barrel domain